MVATLGLAAVAQAAPEENRGGVMGFVAGCCFGVRAAADYNDGKEIHWREWALVVPVVNIVLMVWTGIEGADGMTRADLVEEYGSIYY